MSARLREHVEALRAFVSELEPGAFDGRQAKQLVVDGAELVRLGGALCTLAGGRVAETGAWAEGGAFRDTGAWMASVTGTTVGRARAAIETAERLEGLPETAAALRSGTLSDVQVEAIATAATADPDAERMLLRAAATQGVKGLRDRCAQVEAAASTDQAERYERVRTGRYLWHRRISDVEGLLEMRGPIDVTARVMAALEPHERQLFEQARTAGRREHPEALAFDALAQMADESAEVATLATGTRPPAVINHRIDHTAFTRGHTTQGETCEIAGIGPVPLFVVQKLACDAIVNAVIVDGTDVRAVSHLGRTIPARLRTAIAEQFRECVIAGCHVNRHLELDHNIPVCEGGTTDLTNVAPLCHFHHDHKHLHDLRIEGEGTDRHFVPAPRRPRPPPDP